MALKIRIKNLDDVSKELQELYENDGLPSASSSTQPARDGR